MATLTGLLFFNDDYNKTRITGSAYIWNDAGINEAALRGGDYIVVNSAGAVGNINPNGGASGNKSIDDFFEFGSFQGFFVEAQNENDNVVFRPEMQVVDGNANENFFRKSESNDIQLKMYIESEESYYETLIVLSEYATEDEEL